MDMLIEDLVRRHKYRLVILPFAFGHTMLVVDLLAQRNSDIYPQRVLAVDPATDKGLIKIATCYPDPQGECERPVGKEKDLSDYTGVEHERMRRIKAEYEVAPVLVKKLLQDKIMLNGKGFKNLGPNEYVLSFKWYQKFRTSYRTIEYTA